MIKHMITGLALWLFLAGVWDHDWRMIVAGLATALIWPMVMADVTEVNHEYELDLLWDEDDDELGVTNSARSVL